MLLNCENTGITHFVHIELALPSSEFSVAGREISNEVMAEKRNEEEEKHQKVRQRSGTNNRCLREDLCLYCMF